MRPNNELYAEAYIRHNVQKIRSHGGNSPAIILPSRPTANKVLRCNSIDEAVWPGMGGVYQGYGDKPPTSPSKSKMFSENNKGYAFDA